MLMEVRVRVLRRGAVDFDEEVRAGVPQALEGLIDTVIVDGLCCFRMRFQTEGLDEGALQIYEEKSRGSLDLS